MVSPSVLAGHSSQNHHRAREKGAECEVMALFTPVMLVQGQGDKTSVRQVYGWQDHHGMVCDALGIDRSWYAAHPT